jgi:glutamine synthetase type III
MGEGGRKKRLPNARNMVDAVKVITTPKSIDLFTSMASLPKGSSIRGMKSF